MSLVLQDITVRAGPRCLLNIPKLKMPSTGLIGVIGPNGAGKSTLLKALAGVLPHSGSKQLNGAWPDPRHIAFLPQNFAVTATMTVAECVLLGRRERLGWRVSAQDRADVLLVLSKLDLTSLASARMDRLSGGQQQRVLLAQRLLRNPSLLILDEPTSALDLHHQLEVLSQLKTLSEGILVISALHDLTLAGHFADHLVLIEEGELRASAPSEQVLARSILEPVYDIRSELIPDRFNQPVVVAHRRG